MLTFKNKTIGYVTPVFISPAFDFRRRTKKAKHVTATVDQSVKDFIGNGASIIYKYADPQKAKDWVLVNIDKVGNAIIGDVSFQVTVNNETSRF